MHNGAAEASIPGYLQPWFLRANAAQAGAVLPEVFAALKKTVASRADLLAAGMTSRGLTSAVRRRRLIRIRRDHYALPGTSRHILEAVRIGGRLACQSALAHAGVFAVDEDFTHAHLDRDASRTRHPRDRWRRLTAGERDGVHVHWGALLDPAGEDSVSIVDALAQTLRCVHPWHALAAIDNALHLRLISMRDVSRIFAAAPKRLRYLRAHVEGRAEAGQETVLRMIVASLGLRYEVQVTLPGVGRVDLIVEGWLVLEADSKEAHEGWEQQVRDSDRGLAAARLGYATLRPVYQRTMFSPDAVALAILGALRGRRRRA